MTPDRAEGDAADTAPMVLARGLRKSYGDFEAVRGIDLDVAANEGTTGEAAGRITAEGGRLEAWVIPTDEELMIARHTAGAITGLTYA